ncbi:MAG: DUF4338 domain-containing protein [Planctomycetota bacterium]|jgi:SRSO17 transposase|nr:DUF4338 domain-containing protein [Planctomycetota bacterium]
MNWEGRYLKTPLEGVLGDLDQPPLLHRVDETMLESLWDHLVKEYHYLGYEAMIGRRIKYLATVAKKPVGAISFCSACYKLGPRDAFVGWDEATRIEQLPHLLNNNRFLILPWVRVRHLASHLLALSVKRVRADWERQFGVKPYMVETFVDCERFSGTSYAAANWIRLGLTKGFGRVGNAFTLHGRPKAIYVIVTNSRFRRIFRPDPGRLPSVGMEILSAMNGFGGYSSALLRSAGVERLDDAGFLRIFEDHFGPFRPFIGRKENFAHFVAAVFGLMSDRKRKNIKGLALSCLGPDEVRNLVNLFGKAKLDDRGMLEAHQKDFAASLSHPDGMITGDGCDFPKKGRNSAGVARQYCGRLGKAQNCQAGVALGYSSQLGHGLYDVNLYMPAEWFGPAHAKLRGECGVPEDLEYKGRSRMLSEMIRGAIHGGKLQARYVGLDLSFGGDPSLLDSIPECLVLFRDVPRNHLVFPGRPAMIAPEYGGRGRRPKEKPEFPPRTVENVAADGATGWERGALDLGSKGAIAFEDKCVKVVEVRDGQPGQDVWLYARRLEDGPIKYALCGESMDATRDMVRKPALMRWSVERCLSECDSELGMDHYELRSWTAWKRHILFVLMARLFLTKLDRGLRAETDPDPKPAPAAVSPAPAGD